MCAAHIPTMDIKISIVMNESGLEHEHEHERSTNINSNEWKNFDKFACANVLE